jgi:hypothetical protein
MYPDVSGSHDTAVHAGTGASKYRVGYRVGDGISTVTVRGVVSSPDRSVRGPARHAAASPTFLGGYVNSFAQRSLQWCHPTRSASSQMHGRSPTSDSVRSEGRWLPLRTQARRLTATDVVGWCTSNRPYCAPHVFGQRCRLLLCSIASRPWHSGEHRRNDSAQTCGVERLHDRRRNQVAKRWRFRQRL